MVLKNILRGGGRLGKKFLFDEVDDVIPSVEDVVPTAPSPPPAVQQPDAAAYRDWGKMLEEELRLRRQAPASKAPVPEDTIDVGKADDYLDSPPEVDEMLRMAGKVEDYPPGGGPDVHSEMSRELRGLKEEPPSEPRGADVEPPASVIDAPDVPAAQVQLGDFKLATLDELDAVAVQAYEKGLDVPNEMLKFLFKQAADNGLPMPTTPASLIGRFGPKADDPVGHLKKVLDAAVPGQKETEALWQGYHGATVRAGVELRAFMDRGRELLQQAGLKVDEAYQLVDPTEADIKKLDDLMEAVNESAPPEGLTQDELANWAPSSVPDGFKSIFKLIRNFYKKEESDMLASNPSLEQSFMSHDSYAYRWWNRKKSGADGGGLGSTPGFLKERNDFSYRQMREIGYEPASWNPFLIAAVRRADGVLFREQDVVIKWLHSHGQVRTKEELVQEGIEEGWRIPDVPGPAFHGGVTYPTVNGARRQTQALYLPNKVADQVENLFGKEFEFRIRGKNVVPLLNDTVTNLKRLKLFGSVFQHKDFATRTLGLSFSPTGISKGAPAKLPALWYRMVMASFSKGHRAKVRKALLDGAELYRDGDFVIDTNDVLKAGWQFTDASLIKRSIFDSIERATEDAPAGMKGYIGKQLRKLKDFFEEGLFDGVYVETQKFALENFIVPRIRRSHPSWTAQQVARSAADEVNVMFSTLGPWQNAIQGKGLRFISRMLLFSPNETEAWIKAGSRMFQGRNKRLWREYFAGYFISLALVAEGLHYWATGEHLTPQQLIPISGNQIGALLPGGYDWNGRFLSPALPFKGRNGNTLYLDLIDQGDTFFRWGLNPIASMGFRMNLIPSAVRNQFTGTDFYGRPLTRGNTLNQFGERTRQLAEDLLAPIGIGNLQDVAREYVPSARPFLPVREDRLGITGSLAQGIGVNVKSITTPELNDYYAEQLFGKKYDDLEPYQRDELSDYPGYSEEMDARYMTALDREIPSALRKQQLDKLEDDRLKEQESLEASRRLGQISGREFREGLTNIEMVFASAKAQLDKDYGRFVVDRELPSDPNKRALVEFFELVDQVRGAGQIFDGETYDEALNELKKTWSSSQWAYVQRNTGLKDSSPAIAEYKTKRERYQYFFDVPAKALPDPARLRIWRSYQRVQGDVARERARLRHPWLAGTDKLISDLKERLRMSNAGLDAFLVAYHDSKPLHPANAPFGVWYRLNPWQAAQATSVLGS